MTLPNNRKLNMAFFETHPLKSSSRYGSHFVPILVFCKWIHTSFRVHKFSWRLNVWFLLFFIYKLDLFHLILWTFFAFLLCSLIFFFLVESDFMLSGTRVQHIFLFSCPTKADLPSFFFLLIQFFEELCWGTNSISLSSNTLRLVIGCIDMNLIFFLLSIGNLAACTQSIFTYDFKKKRLILDFHWPTSSPFWSCLFIFGIEFLIWRQTFKNGAFWSER